MIAGVCAGIGEYTNIDPTIVRLAATALLFLSGGTAIVVYLVMALIIPEEPAACAHVLEPGRSRRTERDDSARQSHEHILQCGFSRHCAPYSDPPIQQPGLQIFVRGILGADDSDVIACQSHAQHPLSLVKGGQAILERLDGQLPNRSPDNLLLER